MFLDEPLRLAEHADETVERKYLNSRKNREEAGMQEEEEPEIFSTKVIVEKMNQYYGIGLTTLESKCGGFHVRDTYSCRRKGSIRTTTASRC